MKTTNEELARQTSSALTGMSITSARLGLGAILLLDGFVPRNGASVGVYLRIECAWRLDLAKTRALASEDDRKVLRSEVRVLDGQTIRAVGVDSGTLGMELSFASGARLSVFPVYSRSESYDNWVVHGPEGFALIAGPGDQAQLEQVVDSARGD